MMGHTKDKAFWWDKAFHDNYKNRHPALKIISFCCHLVG